MKKIFTCVFLLLIGGACVFLYLRKPSDEGVATESDKTTAGVIKPGRVLSGKEKRSNAGAALETKSASLSSGKTLIPSKKLATTRPETKKVTPPPVDQETALKRWEDRLAPYYAEGAKERVKETPVTAEDQEEVRELFCDLTPEARVENINHAMNLLPDETFPVVYGILFDKSQSPEIIGVIFHDLLNRDEAIKNPVMEEIVKDKTHPMYVESARILDITRTPELQ